MIPASSLVVLPDYLQKLLSAETDENLPTVTFSDNGRVELPDMSGYDLLILAAIERAPSANEDRSRIDWIVISYLVKKGWTDDQILALYSIKPIGQAGKFAEKGKHGKRYLARTISKVRNRKQEDQTPELHAKEPATDGSTWLDTDAILQPIAWAWKPWLPNGMVTLLASEPGIGKSALMLRIAGCYLLGWPWPDGTAFDGTRGAVLWCEAEAAQAINLDRAKAWGLPLSKLLNPLAPLYDIQLDNDEDKDSLWVMANRSDVRLIVIDSLRGVHGRDENSSETITIVKWLAEIARNADKPILISHHLRKRSIFDSDGPSLDRLRGSSAIVQPTRAVWVLDAPDKTRPEKKRIAMIKNNLARFPEPVGMVIDENGVSFSDAPEPPRVETVTDKATDLLLSLLSGGAVRSTELKSEFEEAGISWSAAERAKKRLAVSAVRKEGRWFWSLPPKN